MSKEQIALACPDYTSFFDELKRLRKEQPTGPLVAEQLYRTFKSYCSTKKKSSVDEDCSYEVQWPVYITKNILKRGHHSRPSRSRDRDAPPRPAPPRSTTPPSPRLSVNTIINTAVSRAVQQFHSLPPLSSPSSFPPPPSPPPPSVHDDNDFPSLSSPSSLPPLAPPPCSSCDDLRRDIDDLKRDLAESEERCEKLQTRLEREEKDNHRLREVEVKFDRCKKHFEEQQPRLVRSQKRITELEQSKKELEDEVDRLAKDNNRLAAKLAKAQLDRPSVKAKTVEEEEVVEEVKTPVRKVKAKAKAKAEVKEKTVEEDEVEEITTPVRKAKAKVKAKVKEQGKRKRKEESSDEESPNKKKERKEKPDPMNHLPEIIKRFDKDAAKVKEEYSGQFTNELSGFINCLFNPFAGKFRLFNGKYKEIKFTSKRPSEVFKKGIFLCLQPLTVSVMLSCARNRGYDEVADAAESYWNEHSEAELPRVDLDARGTPADYHGKKKYRARIKEKQANGEEKDEAKGEAKDEAMGEAKEEEEEEEKEEEEEEEEEEGEKDEREVDKDEYRVASQFFHLIGVEEWDEDQTEEVYEAFRSLYPQRQISGEDRAQPMEAWLNKVKESHNE